MDDLIALHGRLTTAAALEQRWIVLVALVKTRTERGVLFALHQMDELLRTARDSDDGHDIAAATGVAEALVFYQDIGIIDRLPVYQFICWSPSIAPDLNTGELRQNYFWTDHERKSLQAIESAWARRKDQIRVAWERELD